LAKLQAQLCTANVRQSVASFGTMQQPTNSIILTGKYEMFVHS
jgi:hypothetical protein